MRKKANSVNGECFKTSEQHYIDKRLWIAEHLTHVCFLSIKSYLCCYNKLYFSGKDFEQIVALSGISVHSATGALLKTDTNVRRGGLKVQAV